MFIRTLLALIIASWQPASLPEFNASGVVPERSAHPQSRLSRNDIRDQQNDEKFLSP